MIPVKIPELTVLANRFRKMNSSDLPLSAFLEEPISEADTQTLHDLGATIEDCSRFTGSDTVMRIWLPANRKIDFVNHFSE